MTGSAANAGVIPYDGRTAASIKVGSSQPESDHCDHLPVYIGILVLAGPTGYPLGELSEFSNFGPVANLPPIDMGATMLMPVQSGRFKSINRAFPCIVTLALVAAITSELSTSTTWSAAPSPIPSLEVLDRAHKADRLPLRRIERADHELPVGCESVVGSFTRSPLTRAARDCLT